MTIIQMIRARRIIAQVAKRNKVSVSECRSEMIEAIRAADPKVLSRLVGEKRVPSPEEFILLISAQLQ